MTESLGIKIVGLDSGEYIIGIVNKSLEADLHIQAPFVLQVEDLEEESKYKIVIKSYNEFSGNDIIINALKWIDIQDPSNDLLDQYISISDAIDVMKEAKSINMEKVLPQQFKKPRKLKKKRDIQHRWLDNM